MPRIEIIPQLIRLKSLFIRLVVLLLLLVSSSTSALYANPIKLDCDNPEYITVEHEGKGTITYKYCRDENNKVTFAEIVADKTTIEDKDLQEQLLKAFMEAEAPAKSNPSSRSNLDEIFMLVDEDARFPGCEDLNESDIYKSKCAQRKFMQYIYSNMVYPEEARKNETEGTVVVEFVIMKDGTMGEINLLRDLKDGCGQEALRVIKGINAAGLRWVPARKNGAKVKVKYTLPLRFKLK